PAIFRFYTRQILAGLDYNFSNADLLAVLQRIAQERISFVSAFLRLQIVRLVEEHWIDLFLIDEILDVHGLGGFKNNSLKNLFPQHYVFPLFLLLAPHALLPPNLP